MKPNTWEKTYKIQHFLRFRLMSFLLIFITGKKSYDLSKFWLFHSAHWKWIAFLVFQKYETLSWCLKFVFLDWYWKKFSFGDFRVFGLEKGRRQPPMKFPKRNSILWRIQFYRILLMSTWIFWNWKRSSISLLNQDNDCIRQFFVKFCGPKDFAQWDCGTLEQYYSGWNNDIQGLFWN